MAYVKPQVLVYQEFTNTSTSQDTVLRPWIVGRLADIHERGEAIVAEDYWDIKDTGKTATMPDIQAGSTVDKDSVKVYADDAVLRYAQVTTPATTPTSATTTPYANGVPGKPNQIVFTNFNVMTNGDYARNSALGIRDVAQGDIVRVSSYVAGIPGTTACQQTSFTSKVIDFVTTMTDPVINKPARITNANAPTATGVSGTYTGTVADDVYTIHIGTNSYYVTSASGMDDFPTNAALPTADSTTNKYIYNLGKYGLKYSADSALTQDTEITVASADYTSSAATVTTGTGTTATLTVTGTYSPLASGMINQKFKAQVTAVNSSNGCKNIEFRVISESGLQDNYNVQALLSNTNWEFTIAGAVKGQIADSALSSISVGNYWEVTLHGGYDATALSLGTGGTYTGDDDDTYVITCTNGGVVASSKSATSPAISIRTLSGSEFMEVTQVSTDAIQSTFGTKFAFSTGDMMLGETWIIRVESGKNGPVEGIVLRDSLPQSLRTISTDSAIYLNVDFCIEDDVEIGGWEINNNAITVDDNITINSDEFKTTAGAYIPLHLLEGKISVAYREWLAYGAGKFNYVANTDEVSNIPGPLSPKNPVKYAVYKAMANSGGATVVYTTVTGDTLNDWNNALSVASGSREIYTVVPLSQDIDILNLAVALVNADSDEDTCAWKNCFLSVAAPTEQMLVGKSTSSLHPTSTNGNIVTATISNTGDVEITSKGSNGLSNADLSKVKAGDILRVFGNGQTYVPYTINAVTGDTMEILNPPSTSITLGTKIEVWHTLTRDEQVAYIADVAQSFANRRVKLVWPDVVGEGNNELPGTFLCAALAGLVGGSLTNQGLTRVSLNGFDDVSRATPYFTETQIKKLAESGVWVVMEDLDGTIFTMHGLTTNTYSLQYSEEMITRIVDFISFEMRSILEMYIGVTNVTDSTINSINSNIMTYMGSAMSPVYSANGQLITDYEIIDISQDALLKDRINVILSVTIPKATNNIVLRIQAE